MGALGRGTHWERGIRSTSFGSGGNGAEIGGMILAAPSSADPIHLVTDGLSALMPWLIGAGVMALFWALLKTLFLAKLKGAAGEWAVNRALLKGLDREAYHVLPNLLLPDGRGGLTQIDHVVVSVFGVFVIETKNWDCWIFGTAEDRQWTQKYRKGRTHKTMNPLHQNAAHVRVVRELLEIRPEHCHNLVFINPVAKLKTGPVPGVFQRGLLDHIRSFREPVFESACVLPAVETLRATSKADDKVAVAAHLAQVIR